ncbi:M20/M25/M40 family metallo-hydrolase [Cnuibacter physcomitrellae]|uniref:M20 family metallopeptidase n=1 Tax=Cnuibacter physcomitrellae TaxID=1619308 RepID=UPI002175A624|nr:M20/M25/M40 family metallo-hydrolase [Cnuibacter physcomitrellae]MCS5497600.1 M20/M25/M40 family metallo-hydrolase [Cnuibacter physcomitrellae]
MSRPTDVVELAQRLIRVPSPNPGGNERAVAAVITDAMLDLGLPFPRTVAKTADRPNLVSTIDFGPGGRHLVLAGHIDTKPVGDAVWTVDPLAADVDGDRLYGLGSADMKGAIAAMMLAVAGLVGDQEPASGRVTLAFVADEENGAEYGAQHLCQTLDLEADAVVIGEPGGIHDDWDRLHLVSHGIARMLVTASARQGHSSLSGLLGTRNAGVDAARALVAIADRTELVIPENTAGLVDWQATINPALRFSGGVGYGVLPDAISAAAEVRTLPGMRQEDIRDAFVAAVAADPGLRDADVEIDFDAAPNDFLAATSVDPEHPVVAAARRASALALGVEPPLAAFPGTTDATWFDRAGIPTLPALGPGLLSRCHGADEWVSVDALRQAVPLYGELVSAFCAERVEVSA